MRNAIIAVIGDIGSGKSLWMTFLIYSLCKEAKSTIYSNYALAIKGTDIVRMDKKFLKSFFDIKGRAFTTVKNIILAIDEISTFIDSYDQMLKPNKIFSKFILQSRKRDVTFIYSAQHLNSLVPKRIRLVTNYIVRPEYDDDADVLHYSVFRFDGVNESLLCEKQIEQASRYFRFYDSYKEIDILEVDE
jgi:hypothetical protein